MLSALILIPLLGALAISLWPQKNRGQGSQDRQLCHPGADPGAGDLAGQSV